MVNCSSCGFDVGDSKFCPNCGSKIIIEQPKTLCPNCGEDVGESNFCPHCGTKMDKEPLNSVCPNCGEDVGDGAFCTNCGTKVDNNSLESVCLSCGKTIEVSSNFCPYCGWSETGENDDLTDVKIENTNNNFSNGSENKIGDKLWGKLGSAGYKLHKKNVNSSSNRKLFEKTEPVFLEVFDSIEDDFVKAILLLEREKRNSLDGWGIIGALATLKNTPTNGMSHDEAIKFYLDILSNIENEIRYEKNRGTFNEEEFYQRKAKEASRSKLSF